MQAFGLGCFYFGFALQGARETISGSEFTKTLRSALEAIPSVADVEFGTEPTGDVAISLVEVGVTPLCLYPADAAFELAFDVRIPHRLQRELARGRTRWITAAEEFRVRWTPPGTTR